MPRLSSLRARLILYSASITLFVLISLIVVSFITLREFLRESLMSGARYQLRVAMDHIDRDMDRLAQLVNWCSVEDDVAAFVSSTDRYPNDRTFKSMSAYFTVRDAVYANGVDGYVDKLLIGGFDGHSIQFGLVPGSVGDYSKGLEAYKRHTEHGFLPFRWDGLIEEPFIFAEGRSVVPVAKGIYGPQSLEPIGFVFMAVNTEVIIRYLAGFAQEPGVRYFIAIGDSAYEFVDGHRFVKADIDVEREKGLQLFSEGGVPYAEIELDNRKQTLVFSSGERTGWILAQTLPTFQFTRQNLVFARLLVLVALAMLLLLVLLLFTVNRTINRPIARIGRRVALVSTGDFSHDPTIEWDNELGHIGRAINRMSRDIESLIDRRIKDEQSRKALEFRVLQHQINPHFLYNTLNSIKWMATIQKSSGIAEMVSSLATLLRHAAQGAGALVTLERELELVGEYCTIQRYRSANLFTYEVEVKEPCLLKCRVVKFMLQPIVENAIMHGIEPKMAPGVVKIEVSRPDPATVRIDVTDDGVGIESGRLAAVLAPSPPDTETFNRIGLRNVDERLKLAFGEAYGLSVESRLGEYTRVSALLPYLHDQEGESEMEGEGQCSLS